MEQSNLNPEDIMIKKMMTEVFHQEGFHLQLEDEILREAYLSQEKLNEIAAIKRKAKICLAITFALFFIYVLVCTNVFISTATEVVEDNSIIASFNIFVFAGLFLIFYQFIHLRRKPLNPIIPKSK